MQSLIKILNPLKTVRTDLMLRGSLCSGMLGARTEQLCGGRDQSIK